MPAPNSWRFSPTNGDLTPPGVGGNQRPECEDPMIPHGKRPGKIDQEQNLFKQNKVTGVGDIAVLYNWLVVEPTHLKNMRVKLEIFPK